MVSLILFAFNQEKFIEEAVMAALQQTYEPLEIIISDDASTDRTFEIAKTLIDGYRGPHHVTVRVNARNLGVNPHINIAVKEARGQFVVIAAGDDVSLPDRVEKLVKRWLLGASGVFSNASLIDAQSNPKGLFVRPGYKHMADWKEMLLAGTHGAWGCTLSWEKRVFDVFGDMPENILGEDAVIPYRCGLLNGLAYIDEPLVRYRDHGANVSFWAQEKDMGKKEMIELGSRIMQFKEQMYRNWQKDIDLAKNKGIISDHDFHWGQFVLAENILLVRRMGSLLRVAAIRFVYFLPVAWLHFSQRLFRMIPPFLALKKTGWKLLNGVLHYRAPRIHQKIRRLLGRNT